MKKPIYKEGYCNNRECPYIDIRFSDLMFCRAYCHSQNSSDDFHEGSVRFLRCQECIDEFGVHGDEVLDVKIIGKATQAYCNEITVILPGEPNPNVTITSNLYPKEDK